MASEGSPSVPQQPVERWTIYKRTGVWDDVIEGPDTTSPWPPEGKMGVEVVPALVAERLAEALRGINAYFTSGSPDEDDVIAISAMAADALEVYESGGATKPGEET